MRDRKVLIVEDEMIVQMHLRQIVEAYGHEVVGTASSRESALAAAALSPPDLALMDIRLADGDDGIAAAEALRERYDCGIVFITAHSDAGTVARSGPVSSGFVVKPFTSAEVGAAVSTALATRERELDVRSRERELDVLEPSFDDGDATTRRPFDGPTRMLVYSHDTLGLGHLRRCQSVIRGLATRFPELSTLLVTGSPVAHKYSLPPRTDYLKLPAVRKVAPEEYAARSLTMSDAGILSLRKNLLLRTVRDYRPDVLLVDHSPAGMKGELMPTLEHLRRRGGCLRILGLRDVIDDPELVRRQWKKQGVYELLQWGYDRIAVYGTPEVYDTVGAYGLPDDVAAKTSYVHYVGDSAEVESAPPTADGPRRIVLTIGGGDGGAETLIEPFLDMLARHGAELDVAVTALLGPLVPDDVEARLHAVSEGLDVELIRFVERPAELFQRADLVVATAGYNTSVEVLMHARRAILIPRVMHRQEQLIRARRLEAIGLVTCLHPDEVTPARVLDEVRALLAAPAPLAQARADGLVPLDGAQQMAELCAELSRAT